MELPVLPVGNGILPRPDGGTVQGVFLDPATSRLLHDLGPRGTVFLVPYAGRDAGLYPVGLLARVEKLWRQEIYLAVRGPAAEGGPALQALRRARAVFVLVRGLERAKARGFRYHGQILGAYGLEAVQPEMLRADGYPIVCGGGWRAIGGKTEFKGLEDLRVTIGGVDYQGGHEVTIRGNLGGLVTPQQAHSVEHAIVRSLQTYAICTPRTLVAALVTETDELKASIETAYRLECPEIFGVTSSGACGNPLTHLAHFHLMQETTKALARGMSLVSSVEEARRKTMSRLTRDLEITARSGLRILQGLKKGMWHDDTPLDSRRAARIMARFPISPWH